MALRGVACLDAGDLERHDLAVEQAKDGLQRPDPAQLRAILQAPVEAHRLRPGKADDHLAQRLGDDVGGRAAGLLDAREIVIALLLVLDDLGLSERGEARTLEKALRRASGAPTRGPFLSSRTPGDISGTPSITRARRRGVAKLRASPVSSPRAFSPSSMTRRKSSAARDCSRAGISSENSSSSSSAMTLSRCGCECRDRTR